MTSSGFSRLGRCAAFATVKWRIYKAREEVQVALHRDGVVIPITAAPSAKSR